MKPTSGYRTFSRLVSLSVRPSIWTSTSVDLATFAHHLLRGLVRTQALERRRAQLARPRPLDELDLRDELRLDEMGFTRRLANGERALALREGFHRALQLLEHRVGEPGPHLARIGELARVVVADEERPRLPISFALALDPAADHELLAVVVLDLHPDPGAPARLIRRVELLAHDALEPRFMARLEHRRPSSLFVGRRLPGSAFQLQCLELL